MAKKLIKSREVVILKDQIVGPLESQSSPEINIIPTLVSPLVIHDDYRRAGEDNNDSPAELID